MNVQARCTFREMQDLDTYHLVLGIVVKDNAGRCLLGLDDGRVIEQQIEGIRLLTGKSKIDIPLKKKEKPAKEAAPAAPAAAQVASSFTGPVTTKCTVMENDISRVFTVTVEPVGAPATGNPTAAVATAPPPAAAPAAGTPVHSTFAGSVEVIEIAVKVGDKVSAGQMVAKIEAMKAEHEIKAPVDGTVSAVHVELGDDIDSSKPIITIS